ncbi:MAG: lipid A biosynthesis acyltransferase [Alphaproteobacteria bacterium]|nr:lipid A biosynthesis acyltransferase [Alphaproteobacteria bacterium]MDI9329864.1 lipid A biosynthesis acyltransferase [Alphaproteobacteria bacterium]
MRGLGALPLPVLRALGAGLGLLLYTMVPARRRVVLTNLRLCFPHWDPTQRNQVARQVFVHFAQAWLDRGWLWNAPPGVLRQRLNLIDPQGVLLQDQATVLFAPHFVGLDAGWTRLALEPQLRLSTIYTTQSNPVMDDWIKQSRSRLGRVTLYARIDGVKRLLKGLCEGEWLYLLPDMNFGTEESVFVPFYGVVAATVPSLPRFARLGQARVVPVVTRMTAQGYVVEVLPPWNGYPGPDVVADTALMNQRLQGYIDTMPAQYYWVHQRFKSRPEGEPSIYD